MSSTAAADPANGPKTYTAFPMAQHMRLCDERRVSVRIDQSGWWRAEAHDKRGRVEFATVGRTRRHAETNCLIGLGCSPEKQRPVSAFDWMLNPQDCDGPA